MTSKTNKIRNAREANRKFKKKANPLAIEKVVFIDYKDVSLLQRFMSDRSKIRGQRMSGTNVQQQRDLATAIKNAREMALLPYTKRTAIEINADEIGPSLRWATASVERTPRGEGGGNAGGARGGSPAGGNAGGGDYFPSDEEPF